MKDEDQPVPKPQASGPPTPPPRTPARAVGAGDGGESSEGVIRINLPPKPIAVSIYKFQNQPGGVEPSSQQSVSMQSESTAFQIVSSFIFYPLAVVFGFILSIAIVFIFVSLGFSSVSFTKFLLCAVTGFCGVFMPSFLLPKASRWFCAAFLLVLGGVFFYLRCIFFPDEWIAVWVGSTFRAVSLLAVYVCGGLAAVFFHWLKRNSSED